MKKLFWTIVGLSGALVSLLPGVSEAGKNLNHNQTRLQWVQASARAMTNRFAIVLALAAALMSMIPSISEAGRSLNHNQMTLRR